MPDLSAVPNALTKKLGPLPGYAWALIAIGGAYGYSILRKRNAANNAPTIVTVPAQVDPGFYSPVPLSATGGSSVQMANSDPPTNTNAQWARTAADALTAGNQYDPTDIANAISNYINGVALTPVQRAIVNIAIQRFNTPPEGVLPVIAAPVPIISSKPVAPPLLTPPPPPPPAPAPERFYTVVPGDNLSAIATRFYGSAQWQKIYQRNKNQIDNPNLIYAGQVFAIPN